MKLGLVSIFLLISFCSLAQDKFEQAKDHINNNEANKAIELLNPIAQFDLTEQPTALRLLANAHMKNKSWAEADSSLEAAVKLSKATFNQEELKQSLYWISRNQAIQGNFEKAIQHGEKGAYLAKFDQDEAMEFRINNTLSWAYFTTSTDFNKVLVHEKRQFELVNKIGNDAQVALIYNNLGYDLTVAGVVHLDSTVQLMKKANGIYANQTGNKGRWYTLMNLTWQHRLKANYEKSIEYGLLSVEQAKRDNDRHAIIEACFQLGESYMASNSLKQAQPYYEMALEKSLEKEDRDKYVFDVYYAHYLWQNGKKEEAIELLEKVVEFLETSEVFYEMHGRALLSQFYLENDRLEDALKEVEVMDNPRHNYIALETKCLAAITKAKVLFSKGKTDLASTLIKNWLKETEIIGAQHLTKLLSEVKQAN